MFDKMNEPLVIKNNDFKRCIIFISYPIIDYREEILKILERIAFNRSNKYNTLNCNAENFIERAKSLGLEVVDYPVMGGIMVMQKGSTLSGNDGAGHVYIVEDIYPDGSIYTSESGYGSTAFWNQTRSNSNGRWGLSSGYTFRAYIYLPDDVQKVVDGKVNPPAPAPTRR